jgi:hypothetical protein
MQHGKNTNTTSQKSNVELKDVVDNRCSWRLATDEIQHLIYWITDTPPLQSWRTTAPHTDLREGAVEVPPTYGGAWKGVVEVPYT